LLRRQTISISDEDWEHGCQRLVQALQNVAGPPHKPSNRAVRWGLALTVAAVVVVLGVILFLKARSSPPMASSSQEPPTTMPESTRAATEYDKSVAKGYDNAAKVMGDVANKIGGLSGPSVPTITSISSSEARPGTILTINGTFGAMGRDLTVKFGSASARIAGFSLDDRIGADSMVFVEVPRIKPGRTAVVVSGRGMETAPVDFTVKNP